MAEADVIPLACMNGPDLVDKSEVDRLARDLVAASGPGMDLLMAVGGGADTLLARLPEKVRNHLGDAVLAGMTRALDAARLSRRATGRLPRFADQLACAVTGALGGVAGATGALVEMPVAVTIIMRAVMAEAEAQGFDLEDEDTLREVLRVFAHAGPMDEDDGSEMAILVTKASITGATLSSLIQKVAPHFSVRMGQKLAASAVPVLGAAAGASINLIFTNYYRDVAAVHFRMLRMARDSGEDMDRLSCRVRRAAGDLKRQRRAVRIN